MKTVHLITSILFFCLVSSSCQKQEAASTAEKSTPLTPITSHTKMVKVDGGNYQPFYGTDSSLVKVEPFLIDETPVTNAEFLLFVKANPQWQRSQAKQLFADTAYLRDWQSDTLLPQNALPDAPVTYVSWFAAKAYATAVGKRLPTLDEWEFIAMADQTSINARQKKSYSDAIVNLYLIKNRQYNAIKQSPPNYWGIYNVFDLVWEWTDDFNSVLITNDSRSGDFGNKNLVCAGSATSATDVMNYAAFMRFSLRSNLKANYTISSLGFRCAKNISN